MATQLFMKQFQDSFLTSTNYFYASTLASVLALATSITQETSGGSNIQCTVTAGGAALAWISPPLLVAAQISGTITFNCWAQEAATNNNSGMRCLIQRFSDSATILDSSRGTELTASITNQNWTGSPASTLVAAGDRIVIIWKITNVGTMGTGTVTMHYGGPTGAADGDTWVSFTENISFQTAPEFIQTAKSSASGASLTISFASATAVGDLLLALCNFADQTKTLTVGDSKGNFWTLLDGPVNYGTSRVYIWCAVANNAGSSHTVTFTLNTGTVGLNGCIGDYDGIDTSALPDAHGAMQTGNSGTMTSGSATPPNINELLIGAGDITGAGSVAAGTNYVLRSPNDSEFEDRSVTSTASYNATMTATSNTWAFGMYAFKWVTQPPSVLPLLSRHRSGIREPHILVNY